MMHYTGHDSLGFHHPSDATPLGAGSSLVLGTHLSRKSKRQFFAVCFWLILVSAPTSTAWGQSTNPAGTPAVNAASIELAMKLRQSLFNAQRQLPWLEQDVSRSQTISTQARLQLDAHKKELALLTKAIEDLKSAETKSQSSLESLETKSKQQKQTLKKAEDDLAPNPTAEKEKADKLTALRKKAAEAHQAVEKLLGQVRSFEQAIQFNTQRRGVLTEHIGQLDGQLRSKREAELQLTSRVDEAAAEKTKLQGELEKLQKQAVEQRDALKTALSSVQEVAASAKEHAHKVRDSIGNTSPSAAKDKPADNKPADNKPADDKPAVDKPAVDKPADDKPANVAAQAPKASEKPASAVSPPATTAISALTDYQSQLAKLQDAYQLTAQRNQAAQATLEQLSAVHTAIAQAEAKLRDVTTAKKTAEKETQSAKDTLAESEKEMQKLSEATTVFRGKLAEIKKKLEATTTEASQFDKELAELGKQLTAPLSPQEQLALKSKFEATESARRELVQTEQQLTAEKPKLEQIKRALEFNLQLQTKLQWQDTIAEEVTAVRDLEHATAKASLASGKLAAEALTAALQKLETSK